MDSSKSPPGCPGFKICPLKPLDDVPSGRREMWLTKHDGKHHLNSITAVKSNTIMNVQYYGLCITCIYTIRSILGVVGHMPNNPHSF